MPKLKPETELARRQHILDAAERCFDRGGFHRTSMQDICKEAGVSPGALYVYFDSKEALIAGICERNRAELTDRLDKLAEAPDFMAALSALGESYLVDDPASKQRIVAEMGLESARNARVSEIFFGADQFCFAAFEGLFERLKQEGRADPQLDVKTIAKVFMLIGDGLYWRRAIMPEFDMRDVLPVLASMIGSLLRPVEPQRTLEAATSVPSAPSSTAAGQIRKRARA